MVIGVVIGGLELVDALEKRVGDDAPARIAPQITAVQEQSRGMSLVNYLRDTRQQTRTFSAEQLAQTGHVLDVTVSIVGRAGTHYELRWSMYERRRQLETRLPGRAYNQAPVKFVPESPDHVTKWPVWVPYPPQDVRAYVVRFTLLNERGLPVDRRDSREVRP